MKRQLGQRNAGVGKRMISREQAEQAQQILGESLDYPIWLRGIGIMYDPKGSYFLKVNVQALTAEIQSTIPHEVEGVPVQVDVVGRFRPHRKVASGG